jgi:dihydrofolate reductase
MRKVIAAINTSLDGFFDHDKLMADDEIHNHYSELLKNTGILLYGRKTFQLMEYWPTVLKNPTGNSATDAFALIMDKIQKVVFSNTLDTVSWHSARIANKSLAEEVAALQQMNGEPILVGSRSLIMQLLNKGLVDELQICIQPILVANGQTLFENIDKKIPLQLIKTKHFQQSNSIIFYYQPVRSS